MEKNGTNNYDKKINSFVLYLKTVTKERPEKFIADSNPDLRNAGAVLYFQSLWAYH